MAKSNNLASMSVDALLKLRDDVVDMLSRKADDLKQQLSRLGSDKTKRKGRPPARKAKAAARATTKRGKVAAKFRGPGGETWSGRGLKPRWLTSALNEGRTIEEFRIAQPAAKKAKAAKKKAPGRRGRNRKAA